MNHFSRLNANTSDSTITIGGGWMSEQLQIGDVVQLKSGGPRMTIEEIGNFSRTYVEAKCVWFEKSKRESGLFKLEMLAKA